jgi:putative oxidoreductase
MATKTMSTEWSPGVQSRRGRDETEEKLFPRMRNFGKVFARLALGTAFLSSVADRFGLWGAFGKQGVSWGDFQHFTAYTGMVNSFLPARVIPGVALAATVAETVLGLGLLTGIYKRYVTIGSATLLLLFALAMTVSFGVKAAIDYSVFTASSAAFLLFVMHGQGSNTSTR